MFFKSSDKFNLVLVALIYYVTPVVSQGVNVITIPLNKTITFDDREIYGSFIRLNHSSTVEVQFTNIDTQLYFILFQVHTQFENITLSTLSSNSTEISEVVGRNVGLISILKKLPDNELQADTFFIRNSNKNITVGAYISVHGYIKKDPIPGGCNTEWKPKIVPYLKTKLTTDTITLEAAAPSIDADCLFVTGPITTFYMMYLSEMNYDTDVYFEGIRKMMSLKNIKNYGVEIDQTSVAWTMRRVLSAYPGTAVVFVVVAYNNTRYSVYVPTITYSCPEVDEDGCKFSVNVILELLCAVVLFVGLFVSFMGHRFFKTAMFLAGFFGGFTLTYFLVNVINTNMSASALVAAAGLSGIFFGAIWLLFWWLYGIPVIAVFLPALNVGFIFSCIFYYRLPATVSYMKEDVNFWAVFIIITVLIALAMSFVAYTASIMSSSFLGGFCVMFAMDYYFGANMKYIIINTLRRAVVRKFNLVVLAPPFMTADLLVTLMWIFVALSGWAFQHWHNRGRPPFPPPPRSTREAAPGPSMYGAVTGLTRRLFPRTYIRVTPEPPSDRSVSPRPTNRATPEVPRGSPSSLDERAPLLFTAET